MLRRAGESHIGDAIVEKPFNEEAERGGRKWGEDEPEKACGVSEEKINEGSSKKICRSI
jgi:hypothetical protein